MSSVNNNNNITHLIKNRSMTYMDTIGKKIRGVNKKNYMLLGIIMTGLTIFFTYYYYNLSLSILFSIIAFIMFLLTDITMGLVYIIIYINLIVYKYNQFIKTTGTSIKETDINLQGKPFYGPKESVSVSTKDIKSDLLNNKISYGFMLYINAVNNLGMVNNSDVYDFTMSNYRFGDWKSIFFRGDYKQDKTPNVQFPGVWLGPKLNNLSVVFKNSDTNSQVERIELIDVPMNQWFHVLILIEGYSVSLYIDGKLNNTMVLNQLVPSVNELNEYNINIAKDMEDIETATCSQSCSIAKGGSGNGWPGFLSDLVYYPYGLNPVEIDNAYNYYKKITDEYQSTLFVNKKITVPGLIRNGDKSEDGVDVDVNLILNKNN